MEKFVQKDEYIEDFNRLTCGSKRTHKVKIREGARTLPLIKPIEYAQIFNRIFTEGTIKSSALKADR